MFANTTHSIQSIARHETIFFEMSPISGTTRKTPDKNKQKDLDFVKTFIFYKGSHTIPLFRDKQVNLELYISKNSPNLGLKSRKSVKILHPKASKKD